jgi:hypothetical protein
MQEKRGRNIHKTYQLYWSTDIVGTIRATRRAGHYNKWAIMTYTEESWIPNSKCVSGQTETSMDGWYGEDLGKMGIQRWWMVARDRHSWKK